MDEIEIIPLIRPISATIRPPGSKSITNRALLLAAMSSGRSEIRGVLLSDDTNYMIEASLSSQFVSGLLMPGALWGRGLDLNIRGDAGRPFIEMTRRMMEEWGVHTETSQSKIMVPGQQNYQSRDFEVEADASAASYF